MEIHDSLADAEATDVVQIPCARTLYVVETVPSVALEVRRRWGQDRDFSCTYTRINQ